MTDAREMNGERGSPTPGTNDSDFLNGILLNRGARGVGLGA